MPDCGRFTNLELLKKQRYKILFSNNQSRLSNYGILQDIESYHQVWKQENMETVRRTLDTRVMEIVSGCTIVFSFHRRYLTVKDRIATIGVLIICS